MQLTVNEMLMKKGVRSRRNEKRIRRKERMIKPMKITTISIISSRLMVIGFHP